MVGGVGRGVLLVSCTFVVRVVVFLAFVATHSGAVCGRPWGLSLSIQ